MSTKFKSGEAHPDWQQHLPSDALGQTYGSWVVVSTDILRKHRTIHWRVRCGCGKEVWRPAASLRNGKSSSCVSCSLRKGPHFKVLGRRYDAILSRCTNPSNPSWPRYGGRGIECRFSSREGFVRWVSEHLPHATYAGTTIDRVDGDGHYEPGNLRLATQREQMGNMCRNRRIEYRGRAVLITHLWHLLKTDYPEMALGPRRTVARLLKGESWKDIVALPRRESGGRKAKAEPVVDAEVLRIYSGKHYAK